VQALKVNVPQQHLYDLRTDPVARSELRKRGVDLVEQGLTQCEPECVQSQIVLKQLDGGFLPERVLAQQIKQFFSLIGGKVQWELFPQRSLQVLTEVLLAKDHLERLEGIAAVEAMLYLHLSP